MLFCFSCAFPFFTQIHKHNVETCAQPCINLHFFYKLLNYSKLANVYTYLTSVLLGFILNLRDRISVWLRHLTIRSEVIGLFFSFSTLFLCNWKLWEDLILGWQSYTYIYPGSMDFFFIPWWMTNLYTLNDWLNKKTIYTQNPLKCQVTISKTYHLFSVVSA